MSGFRPVGVYGAPGYFQPRYGATMSPLTVRVLRGTRAETTQPQPRAPGFDIVTLDPIQPEPVRDFRALDFTAMINDSEGVISTAQWDCAVHPQSTADDPSPEARLVSDPMILGQASHILLGDMIADVTYILTAQIGLHDGRILVTRGYILCSPQTVPQPEEATGTPGVVAFDFQKWIARFPEFANPPAGTNIQAVTAEQAYGYWLLACEIVRNDPTSPVQNLEEREEILFLLTAHIAALLGGPMGGGGFSPQLAGLITSKSVYGVSIGSTGIYPGVSGTQAWYQQTRYGQLAWMKMRAYRLFYYVPGFQRSLTAWWHSWPYQVGGLY